MMKHLYLHIGYPKTGSSALQTVFLASRGALSQAGVFFPSVHAGLCNAVVARFSSCPDALFPYSGMVSGSWNTRQQIDRDFSKIDLALYESKCLTAVISSESLIALEPQSILELREWLLTKADDVTVVCYVRRPVDYTAGVVQERVKWGERIPLSDIDLPIARFEHQLPSWEAVFGRKNMVVRSANREDLFQNDVVADFSRVVRYSGELNRFTEYKNERISHVAVLLLDALNGLDNSLVSSNQGFQGLWGLPGDKYLLSPDLVRSVEIQSRPHLRYLQDYWGIQFQPGEELGGGVNEFDRTAAQGVAAFIKELHEQARASEPLPFVCGGNMCDSPGWSQPLW